MRTENDILTDIYKIVKGSPINNLDGGIWRQTRPTDSQLQDCVISLITGGTHKFLQSSALYVKIFYKDLFYNNTYSQDFVTAGQMQTLLFDLSETLLKTNGYSFDIQSRDIHSEQVQTSIGVEGENKEHYMVLIINFQNTL